MKTAAAAVAACCFSAKRLESVSNIMRLCALYCVSNCVEEGRSKPEDSCQRDQKLQARARPSDSPSGASAIYLCHTAQAQMPSCEIRSLGTDFGER